MNRAFSLERVYFIYLFDFFTIRDSNEWGLGTSLRTEDGLAACLPSSSASSAGGGGESGGGEGDDQRGWFMNKVNQLAGRPPLNSLCTFIRST